MLFTFLFVVIFVALCYFVAPVTVTPDVVVVDIDETLVPTWEEIWDGYAALCVDESCESDAVAGASFDSWVGTMPSESVSVSSDAIAAAAGALLSLAPKFDESQWVWTGEPSLEDALLVGQYWIDRDRQVIIGEGWLSAA